MKKVIIGSIIIISLITLNVGLGYKLYQKISSSTKTVQPTTADGAIGNSVDTLTSTSSALTQEASFIPGTLGMDVTEFKNTFNSIVRRHNYDKLLISSLPVRSGSLQDTATYIFSDTVGLMLTINKADHTIRDISLFYSADTFESKVDFILAMGIIVEVTNPNLPAERRKDVLDDFGLLNHSPQLTTGDFHEYSVQQEVIYQFTNGAGIDGTLLLFNASSVHDTAITDKIASIETDKKHKQSQYHEFINGLKKTSRFQTSLRDREGTPYELYVVPVREEKQITSEDQIYARANEGDVVYKGKYDLLIVKAGDAAVSDHIPFYTGQEEDSFNTNRTTHYVVSTPHELQPDIMVITQYGSSNVNILYLYLIDQGKLERLSIVSRDKSVSDDLWSSSKLRSLGNGQYEIRSYNNHDGLTYVTTYQLNINKLQLIEESTRTLSGIQLQDQYR